MLYKKYHRNYVSQFKEGAKFKYPLYSLIKVADGVVEKVNGELCYEDHYSESIVDEIVISPIDRSIYITSKTTYNSWVLIFLDGKINYNIKIEKDVI